MRRLTGKTAVVTGGARSIGAAICARLAAEGAQVAVTDIHDREGHQLAESISESGGTAQYWRMDVTHEADVRKTLDAIATTFGRIDILVNNAGVIGTNKPTTEITEADWDRVMAVNVKGVFFCTKYAVPHMIRQSGGSIINVGSIYGTIGAPNAPPYHASKGAVRMMTKTDALLFARQGIRVNAVHPGFIHTAMLEKFVCSLGERDSTFAQLDAMHPLGHIGEPEDVAAGVLYLASDDAKFVTGTELVIDGGYTAR